MVLFLEEDLACGKMKFWCPLAKSLRRLSHVIEPAMVRPFPTTHFLPTRQIAEWFADVGGGRQLPIADGRLSLGGAQNRMWKWPAGTSRGLGCASRRVTHYWGCSAPYRCRPPAAAHPRRKPSGRNKDDPRLRRIRWVPRARIDSLEAASGVRSPSRISGLPAVAAPRLHFCGRCDSGRLNTYRRNWYTRGRAASGPSFSARAEDPTICLGAAVAPRGLS